MRMTYWVLMGWLLTLSTPLQGARADEAAEATPAEQAALIIEALGAETTAPLAKTLAGKDAAAGVLQKQLAPHSASVAQVAAALRQKAEALAARDGEAAAEITTWVEKLAMAARKAHPKEADAAAAQRDAAIARGIVSVSLGKKPPAIAWCKAADYTLEAAALRGRGDPDEAWIQALALLHDGSTEDGAAERTLLDHAGRICAQALKRRADSEPVRRAVVASYRDTAKAMALKSRKSAQSALISYFDAFAPLTKKIDRPAQADVREWNQMITLAREEKIKVKENYLGPTVKVASNLLSALLPATGTWASSRGVIRQAFESRELERSIRFDTYSWSSVYRMPGSTRTVGGDNVKGVATRNFETYMNSLKDKGLKIKKPKKPARRKLNKILPAGIEWSFTVLDDEGEGFKVRVFTFKAVKSEITVEITIRESVVLTAYEPEFEAILESLDVVKKKR